MASPQQKTAPSFPQDERNLYTTSQPTDYTKYNHKAAFSLGLTQILCGIAAILLQILTIVFKSDLAAVGVGFWTGSIFILAGAFGMGSSRKKTKCFIIITTQMSILAACMGVVLVGMSASSVAADVDDKNYNCSPSTWCNYVEGKASRGRRVGVNCMMLAVAIGELVIAILQAVFCCSFVCGGKSHTVITYGQSVMVPQTWGYPTPIMATTSPLGDVVLSPQALGYSVPIISNPTIQAGQVTFVAATDIPRGSTQDPHHYEVLHHREP